MHPNFSVALYHFLPMSVTENQSNNVMYEPPPESPDRGSCTASDDTGNNCNTLNASDSGESLRVQSKEDVYYDENDTGAMNLFSSLTVL